MDGLQFDTIVRSFTESRRSLLGTALAATAGWLGVAAADARKKRKHKKRKPKAKPNEYGCLEVDDPCKRESDCCSGICEGKRERKRAKPMAPALANKVD